LQNSNEGLGVTNVIRKGHWEKECNKKNQDESKLNSEVNVTTIDDFEVDSASFFTSATLNVIITTFLKRNTKNVWYANGRAIDHLIDMSEWFNTFEEILVGKWPVMVANNQKLLVCGVGIIKVPCVINGRWERSLSQVLYMLELKK
jgi:hypothetical protein